MNRLETSQTRLTASEYRRLLVQHDWFFAWSDDYSVYKRGSKALDLLEEAQKRLDPDFKYWNFIAPKELQKKVTNG